MAAADLVDIIVAWCSTKMGGAPLGYGNQTWLAGKSPINIYKWRLFHGKVIELKWWICRV